MLPHNQIYELTVKNPLYRREVLLHTASVLALDLGEHGDITTDAVFAAPARGRAIVITGENGIFAGEQEARFFLAQHSSAPRIYFKKKDGEKIRKGQILFELAGDVRMILAYERTLLNLVGRMSGVATGVSLIVQKVRKINSRVLITPTRKTLWGLLDKRACALGGAGTHRLNLSDAILIKDNHLDAFGRDVQKVLMRCVEKIQAKSGKRTKDEPAFIEIEVESLQEALVAAKTFHDLHVNGFRIPAFLLLDNLTPQQVSRILKALVDANLRNTIGIEISGGINPKNIMKYAKLDVDVISMGALTHSAKTLDLSLKLI